MSVELEVKSFKKILKRQSLNNLKNLKLDYEKMLNNSVNKSYYKLCFKHICNEIKNRK